MAAEPARRPVRDGSASPVRDRGWVGRRGRATVDEPPAVVARPPWLRRWGMVQDLRKLGVNDERVLAAMAMVPRERFLPAAFAADAYTSSPLPIPAGQTISAPYIVAVMTAALELTGTERVLEVGTGSGYGAAILSRCAAQVLTIEYHPRLARSAARVLARQGYRNVEVRLGDGARGAPDQAPFEAISMTAMAAGELPATLVEQLAAGGRLVGPVGPGPGGGDGELLRLSSSGNLETLMDVRFVPLIIERSS